MTRGNAQKPIFVIAIVGPTATGKSDFAVQIAKLFDGEIISADSRQVYKGLDIGTGKITKKEMLNIPHYGLDIISPKKVFTAADFQKYTQDKIVEMASRQKVPIICGGTGFYIDAALGKVELSEVAPNHELRKSLEKLTTPRLLSMLKKLNPKRFAVIDQNNRVRIIRAIEIEKGHKELKKKKHKDKQIPETAKEAPNYSILWLGLDASDQILKNRISKRLTKRLDQGMIREAQELHREGLTYKRMFELGLEYRYLSLYLQKKITKDELTTQLDNEIWHYVKRQRAWFKRNHEVIWIDRA